MEIAKLYATVDADVDEAEKALQSYQRALVESESAAIRLERAQEKLNANTDPGKQRELANAVERAKLQFDQAAGKADRLQREIQELNTAPATLDKIKTSATGVSNALGNIGLGVSFAGLTAGAIGLGGEMLNLAMKAETNTIAFETMLGSTGKAQAHLNTLRDFAASTPFQFNDLVDASKKMQAFGFESEQVVPMLTNIGDAVAALGSGSQGIDAVTRALGQMQAKQKVQAGEMLQLTEAGIPAWEYLAEAIGKSTGETMKLSEKGLIPAEQAIQAILAGMEKDFGGLMAEQADTASGRLSNLVDKLEAVGTAVGEDMLEPGKMLIEMLTDAADAALLLATAGDQLKATYQSHSQNVVTTARSYEEYQAELQRAAEVMGYLVDEQGNLVNRQQVGRVTTESLIQANYQYTESTFNAVRATVEYGLALDEDAKVTRLAGIAQGEFGGKIEETKEQLQANAEAVKGLSALMAGAVGNELQSFADKQTELKDKAEEYKNKIAELSTKKYLTPEQQADLENTKTKLGEVNTALDENAAAHEDAMKRVVFSILQQQAAADGFTTQEVAGLMLVAENWGLVDQATANATKAISESLAELSEDGNLEKFRDDANSTLGVLLGWPKEVKTTFTFQTVGQVPGAGEIGLPGGSEGTYNPTPTQEITPVSGAYAQGGSFVVPGSGTGDRPYAVNLTPGEGVSVTPVSAMPFQGGGSQIGTVNLYVSGAGDPARVADEVMDQLERRGLIASGRLR